MESLWIPSDPVVEVIGPLPYDWFRYRAASYSWTHEGERYRLRLVDGFECDGASIPWIAQKITGKWSLGKKAPGMHDALCRCKGDLKEAVFGKHKKETAAVKARAGERYLFYERLNRQTWEWEEVDHVWPADDMHRLFGKHMREDNIGKWRRRAAYRMVKWFGKGSCGS